MPRLCNALAGLFLNIQKQNKINDFFGVKTMVGAGRFPSTMLGINPSTNAQDKSIGLVRLYSPQVARDRRTADLLNPMQPG
jgi:hypothetical protein